MSNESCFWLNTFTLSHLADDFIQNEDNGSNQSKQTSNDMQVL